MQNLIFRCLGTLGFLLVAAAVAGQTGTTTPAQQDERIVVGTNLVTLNVIVTDSKGRYVKGLTRDQFQIYDDKTKQEIAHFSTGAAPVSLAIIYEIQPGASERTRAMLAAIKQFASTLDNGDDFFFVAFNDNGRLTTDFVPTAAQVFDHLEFFNPSEPCSFYDVVYLAADRLQEARNLKKAMLVISDGQDEHSQYSYKELRNRLRTLDAQVYAIGIADAAVDSFAGYGRWVFEDITRQTGRRSFLMNSDSTMGRAVLAEMSRVSGGTSYIPETESEPELAGICEQIALELRQQYTLGFYSRETDGRKWHRLKVRLEQGAGKSGLTLSYREGYQLARS
jgi:Ca-activated chloride channel family protein